MSKGTIVYIGDFDLRNENVQAHLVRNNGRLFNELGYKVYFIGVNRECKSFDDVKILSKYQVDNGGYLELPFTLSTKGIVCEKKVENRIITYLNKLTSKNSIKYVISYQAPTYALVLKRIAQWCYHNKIPYIVNCADLPVFDSQPIIKRLVMKLNWRYLHCINKKMADGIISVSRYIEDFYHRPNRPSIVLPPLFNESCASQYGCFSNDVVTFLYAGTPFVLSEREINTKGMKDRLDKVIDLMVMLEKNDIGFRFNIVGIELCEYCKCVPRHRAALEKSKKIVFHGKKTHEETLRMLANSDYMINYRDSNLMTEAGVSTKVVESVSIGIPVVMNEIGDHFKYLEDGISGIKLTGNSKADYQLLYKLCNLTKESRLQNKQKIKKQAPFSIYNYIDSMGRFLGQTRAHRAMKDSVRGI